MFQKLQVKPFIAAPALNCPGTSALTPPNATMLCRRDFLLTIGAATMTPVVGALAQTPPKSNSASAELDQLLDAFMQERLQRSPEDLTDLGLDKGPFAAAKRRLDDRSLAAVAEERRDTADRLRRLKAIDRTALSGQSAVNYDVVAYWLEADDEANRRFDYASSRPYVLSQMHGAYQSVPDFLDTKHAIETKTDADSYLSRLAAFPTAIDQETERLRHDSAQGVVPPDFVLGKALEQLAELARTPANSSVLVSSLVRRTQEKGIAGDFAGLATRIYQQQIVPALQRQIAALTFVKATAATHDAGIWKLKNGDACYASLLKVMTTTSMDAEEIHNLGLERTAEISSRLDGLLRAEGLTQGTVGERLRVIFKAPKYQYPDTNEGRDQLLADLKLRIGEIRKRLPSWFKTLPKAEVILKRVPLSTEIGAPGAYYERAALDGSRPGICYFNLHKIEAWPKWRPASILYHEAIPGHHLQNALSLEKPDLPLLIKTLWFAAYGEGWALYAEQLAEEIGMYENDPLSRIGYWHAALLRAGRLVADTGLHAKRWTRERAINYFADLMGVLESVAESEIDRYCVGPGQACSYMIGKITWLRLRERAQKSLGTRFDIRAFHDAGLLSGPMPLMVLERVIDDYIQNN